MRFCEICGVPNGNIRLLTPHLEDLILPFLEKSDGLRNSESPTSDNLTPQKTTNQLLPK